MMSTATRATARPAAPAAALRSGAVAAILSDRPDAIAAAARAAGLAPRCATAETLWLLPVGAPAILILDLPVSGVSDRRLSLLLRQLCRACPDLVIALHDPAETRAHLPRDIEIDKNPSDAAWAETFAEALHLMPAPAPATTAPPRLFSHQPGRRHTLFR